MKKPKGEDVIFIAMVIISLIAIVYCLGLTVVKSIKENPIGLDDTLFVTYKPSVDLIKDIPKVIQTEFGSVYKTKDFDDEAIVKSVKVDVIKAEIDGKKKSFELSGIDVKYDVLSQRIKEGDTIHIDYGMNNNTYIYMSDGTMVQHWLLINGYAVVSNVEESHREDFEAIQTMAQEKKAGIWAE